MAADASAPTGATSTGRKIGDLFFRLIVQPDAGIQVPMAIRLGIGMGTDWYKGAVDGSFDGAIKAVDLSGSLQKSN